MLSNGISSNQVLINSMFDEDDYFSEEEQEQYDYMVGLSIQDIHQMFLALKHQLFVEHHFLHPHFALLIAPRLPHAQIELRMEIFLLFSIISCH